MKPIAPFDAAQDLADAPRTGGGQKPKDAATLILTRGGDRPEVLMGRRAPGHVFMASKWVFPGGRIDRSDFTAAATGELSSDVARRLEAEMPARRARALDLPAITRFVLGEMAERLTHPDRPLPFVRMVRGQHVVEHRD